MTESAVNLKKNVVMNACTNYSKVSTPAILMDDISASTTVASQTRAKEKCST